MMFPEEKHISFKDWIFRFNKLRFDYRGQLGLFEGSAQVIDESGVDTNISTIKLKQELAF